MSDDEENDIDIEQDDDKGNQLLDRLATVLENQNNLLENSNTAKFQYKFIGKNHETLTWIFAAEKFLKINHFKNESIKFQRIFMSLNEHFQNRYLMDTDDDDDDNMTFDSLKYWMLREYPPPKTKYEFKLCLMSMLMYKNEDPNLAYSRFKYKLKLINRAIRTINEGLMEEANERYPDNDDNA